MRANLLGLDAESAKDWGASAEVIAKLARIPRPSAVSILARVERGHETWEKRGGRVLPDLKV
jgi:hypothetical protein